MSVGNFLLIHFQQRAVKTAALHKMKIPDRSVLSIVSPGRHPYSDPVTFCSMHTLHVFLLSQLVTVFLVRSGKPEDLGQIPTPRKMAHQSS
jgi:hypothetical protein